MLAAVVAKLCGVCGPVHALDGRVFLDVGAVSDVAACERSHAGSALAANEEAVGPPAYGEVAGVAVGNGDGEVQAARRPCRRPDV